MQPTPPAPRRGSLLVAWFVQWLHLVATVAVAHLALQHGQAAEWLILAWGAGWLWGARLHPPKGGQ